MRETTKHTLAQGLKELLSKETLDQITVVHLVEHCQVNRQTFYYHFKDIYDLLEWTYLSDGSKAIGNCKTHTTWQEGLLHVFEYLQANKSFIRNTYYSVSRDYLEHFLYTVTFQLLLDVLEVEHPDVSEKQLTFIAKFYQYAFVGIVLDWIREGMKENPEHIVQNIHLVIEGNFEQAATRFCH